MNREAIRRLLPNWLIEVRRYVLYGHPIRALQSAVEKRRRVAAWRSSLGLSQAGQDFWVYGEVFNEMRGGYFVDIGAFDGIRYSNTYVLESRYGWNGILVEANPRFFRRLERNRTSLCVNACIDSTERQVKFLDHSVGSGILADDCDNEVGSEGQIFDAVTVPLAKLLRDYLAPTEIDYLSIDIEGAEDRALLRFPFKEFMFKCMTIERPSSALRGALSSHGYMLVKEIPGLDCFFVHGDFLSEYFENLMSFYEKSFELRPRGTDSIDHLK